MIGPRFATLPNEDPLLGRPLVCYKNYPSRLMQGRWLAVFAGLGLAGACLSVVLLLVVDSPTNGRPPLHWLGLVGCALFAGLLLLFVGVLVAPAYKSSRTDKILTHTEGLSFHTLDGVIGVRWDDIRRVWDNGRRFETHAGQHLSLPVTLDSVEVLGDLVLRKTYERLLEQVGQELFASAAEFGPLKLDRDGLHCADAILRWTDLKEVTVENGSWTVRRLTSERVWLELPYHALPNGHVFLATLAKACECFLTQGRFDADNEQAAAPINVPSETATTRQEHLLQGEEKTSYLPSSFAPEPGHVGSVAPTSVPEVYRADPKPTATLLVALGLLTVFGGVVICFSLSMFALPVRGEPVIGVIFLGLGLALFLSGLLLVRRTYRRLALAIAVTAEGLIVRQGAQRTIYRWDDVERELWEDRRQMDEGPQFEPRVFYHLVCRKGQQIRLDDWIAGLPQLVTAIQERTCAQRLPRLLAALEAGHSLDFGAFHVDRRELRCGDLAFDWSDLTDAAVVNAVVVLTKRNSWVTWGNVAVTQVPDSHLLVALVRILSRDRSLAGTPLAAALSPEEGDGGRLPKVNNPPFCQEIRHGEIPPLVARPERAVRPERLVD